MTTDIYIPKAGTYRLVEAPDPGPDPGPSPGPDPVPGTIPVPWAQQFSYRSQGFTCGAMLIFQMYVPPDAVPSNPGNPSTWDRVTVSEYGDLPTIRMLYVSLVPGDINNPLAVTGGQQPSLYYGVGLPTGGGSVGLQPGSTVYFNLVNDTAFCNPGQSLNVLANFLPAPKT